LAIREKGMSMSSRKEYVARMRERYIATKAKAAKTRLLDELVEVTGYNRKYAIRLLSGKARPALVKTKRQRRRLYGECMSVVALVWEALDYCCAERLHPRLLPVAEQLNRHHVVYLTPEIAGQLSTISRATLGRRLKEMNSPKTRVISRPRGGCLIKTDIPIARYEWNESRPGALEADVVEHNGGSTSGQYACTLSVTDIVTGWSRRHAVLGRGQAAFHEALTNTIARWPYSCWGLHADNGPEFLSGHVQRFTARHRLEHTRSRPYKKNDNAHVEQRNRFLREIVGYDRYDTPEAVAWLNQVYDLLDRYANLVLPTMKLVDKRRRGAKVRKIYDTPRPPYQRVIETGVLTEMERLRLEREVAAINPLELHREIQRLLDRPPVALSDQQKRSADTA
jgi:hypothetical protein